MADSPGVPTLPACYAASRNLTLTAIPTDHISHPGNTEEQRDERLVELAHAAVLVACRGMCAGFSIGQWQSGCGLWSSRMASEWERPNGDGRFRVRYHQTMPTNSVPPISPDPILASASNNAGGMAIGLLVATLCWIAGLTLAFGFVVAPELLNRGGPLDERVSLLVLAGIACFVAFILPAIGLALYLWHSLTTRLNIYDERFVRTIRWPFKGWVVPFEQLYGMQLDHIPAKYSQQLYVLRLFVADRKAPREFMWMEWRGESGVEQHIRRIALMLNQGLLGTPSDSKLVEAMAHRSFTVLSALYGSDQSPAAAVDNASDQTAALTANTKRGSHQDERTFGPVVASCLLLFIAGAALAVTGYWMTSSAEPRKTVRQERVEHGGRVLAPASEFSYTDQGEARTQTLGISLLGLGFIIGIIAPIQVIRRYARSDSTDIREVFFQAPISTAAVADSLRPQSRLSVEKKECSSCSGLSPKAASACYQCGERFS